MPANQTIPITLTWGPVAPGFEAADINELGELLAKQLAGAIRVDVSFILQTLSDPTTFVTPLIFNSTQNVFKGWDTTVGRYVPINQFAIGDVKNSFIGTDTLATGWVVLDGRAITAIPGLSGAQQVVLETLFSPGGSLPIVIPQNISGLPPAGSFSDITIPEVLPANGVIGALPMDNPPTGVQALALVANTEILRDSAAAVEVQVAAIQAKAEQLLVALHNNTTPKLYTLLFIGFA